MSIEREDDSRTAVREPCEEERETVAYFAGDLSGERLERAERHIVECDACRKTIAMLARMTSPDLSPEDARLVDELDAPTAAAARSLFRSNLERARPRAVRWVALAASVALACSIGLAVWLARPAPDANVERGMAALRTATRERRPTELRVTGLDYAPHREVRAGNRDDADLLGVSRDLLEAAVDRNPTPEARHALGRALIASNDSAGAIAQLELARAAAPSDAGVLTDLAVARAAAGDAAGAAADLDRALAVDPSRAEALFDRALLRIRAGRTDDARADLSRYLELDPNSPWADEARRLLERLDAEVR